MYRISIGGEELHAVENSQPEEFHNVKVYASDPWYPAQPGSIRNLVIESTVQVTYIRHPSNSAAKGSHQKKNVAQI